MPIRIDKETLQKLRDRGMIAEEKSVNLQGESEEQEEPKAKQKDFVQPLCVEHKDQLVFVVPVQTFSANDSGSSRRAQIGRSASQRKKVSAVLGKELCRLAQYAEAYHKGQMVRVKLVRLSPRRLDVSNLYRAIKHVEDSVALMLGADDGDPRWQMTADQETSKQIGLRIELSLS